MPNNNVDFYDELHLPKNGCDNFRKYDTCVKDLVRNVEIALNKRITPIMYKDGGTIEFNGIFCKVTHSLILDTNGALVTKVAYDKISLYGNNEDISMKMTFKASEVFRSVTSYVQFLENVFSYLVESNQITKEELDRNVYDIRLNMRNLITKLIKE